MVPDDLRLLPGPGEHDTAADLALAAAGEEDAADDRCRETGEQRIPARGRIGCGQLQRDDDATGGAVEEIARIGPGKAGARADRDRQCRAA